MRLSDFAFSIFERASIVGLMCVHSKKRCSSVSCVLCLHVGHGTIMFVFFVCPTRVRVFLNRSL